MIFSDLLSSHEGLFLPHCDYDVDKLNTLPDLYCKLLLWWSKLRDVVDCTLNMMVNINILFGTT